MSANGETPRTHLGAASPVGKEAEQPFDERPGESGCHAGLLAASKGKDFCLCQESNLDSPYILQLLCLLSREKKNVVGLGRGALSLVSTN
jgi:hypothetical protein